VKSQKDVEESFHAGQTRILEMVAADAPLPDILKSIVMLMEAQVEGMLCSILVLTTDGHGVRHGAARVYRRLTSRRSMARRSARSTVRAGRPCS
jgi:hypothetical protein